MNNLMDSKKVMLVLILEQEKCKKCVRRNAQNACFDVKVTNVNSDTQKNMPVEKILSKHEQDKKRNYTYFFLQETYQGF